MKLASVSFPVCIIVVSLLIGCMVGPDYQRPGAMTGTNSLPSTFSAETNAANGIDWKIAEPLAHLPHGSWWTIFNDSELDRLERLSLSNNQEVAANLARFEEARSEVNVARSDLFPHLSAASSMVNQRTSPNQFDAGKPNGTSYRYNNFAAGLEAGWEADLFGRVRREVQAARARLNSANDDIEATKLAIQAEIAIDYFTLRSLDDEVALLKQTVDTYAHSLELTRNRRIGGVGTDLDVSQAETQLKSTQAQVPVVVLRRAKLLHALATLCGVPAPHFELTPSHIATPTVTIPLSLPSELLERRPDIASAERRMAAANAEIGVAKTAFYPRIFFSGFAGFQSINAGTLFDWPSRIWSIGPSLSLPLFTGGRNRAQLAIAHSAYEETTANYRQTVLTAFQEVEDQLAAQHLLAVQFEFEDAALIAARRTLEIANNRYKAGLVTYLEVAISQSAVLDHERTVVQLSAEQLAATVGLAKALGGGWSEQQPVIAAQK